jgi:large repetitive protein
LGSCWDLEQTTDRTAQTLMSLDFGFLNASTNLLGDLEPAFPGAYDVLHGRYVHRTDSIDVDMYRFEVNLGPGARTGTLTAETFAERLPDASLLDTTLTLYQDVRASVTTDFNVGTSLSVKFTSVQPGALGNSAKLEFLRTDRAIGDSAIRIRRTVDASGNNTTNGLVIDVPRRSANVPSVSIGSIVSAINNHPVASTMFEAEILVGSPSIDVSFAELTYSPLSLSGGGIVQLSRNDDYFSEDSQLKASLPNGVYYVGVASTGNDTYDPTIPNSGFGGTTQGKYELLLKFEPQVNETDAIRDLDSSRVGVPGTAIDGDGDGVAGGVNNFWFQTRPEERKFVVTGNGSALTPGQTFTVTGSTGVSRRFEFVPSGGTASPGNIAIEYLNLAPASTIAGQIRSAINRVSSATLVRAATETSSIVTLEGERTLDFSSNTQGIEVFGRTLFVDKTAGVNADGSEDRPFNNIANSSVPNAFGAARASDIVRIVGNGGQDRNANTRTDNFSYKIGTTETGGGTLEDGRNMNVPQGVTVMIDAGAIFKLRNSVISVGSTNLLADRSQGALQVLGTPRVVTLTEPDATSTTNPNGVVLSGSNGDVIFTSTRDRSVDAQASGNSSAPTPGNWGGLIYRRDIDQNVGRFDLEDEGIFLQSVNHADIRYGGSSNILIDSNQQLVNPIQIFNLRPTITFNDITFSADAAISASPDSFEESSFQSQPFQQAGKFTADYSRVGPAINNNLIVDNSINGLFIRVATTPGTPPQALTVAGRFDDIDVVHYIAENVIIAGTPGGSIEDGVRPDLSSTAFSTQSGGTLAAGSYDYRVTLVDANGFESLASLPSATVTVTNNFSIRLINLPPVQANSDYTGRRLYRRELGTGEYRLVTQLDANSTTYFDNGDGVRPDLRSAAFTVQPAGTLAAGSYNYRLTFVDASGFESIASVPSASVNVVNASSAIRLANLPPVPANSGFTGRRLYRLQPGTTDYRLVTSLDATVTSFVDTGATTGSSLLQAPVLDLTRTGVRGRLDASLVIDPGTVVKLRGARIELGHGTQLLAEGLQSKPVIFTSYADDRFGAGGTFDTNNDTESLAGIVAPARGDWSGIYAAPTSRVSIDNASVAYGGGVSLIDGGESRGFAALELQQADARVANSRFEFNEDGQDGAGPVGRFGRLAVAPSTIFVRGSQPIIVGNQFIDNRGSIIDIDSDSMTADRLVDIGRQTGDVDRFAQLDDNFGPLIRLNRYENVAATVIANRQISGLEIRGGVLATESVWDDTDIVHMLFDSITVGNLHSVGGLRLMSRNDESLVVKLTGAGSQFNATSGTGITATGSLTNIDDRIGGSVQIIGKPGAPVVLTSFLDDTAVLACVPTERPSRIRMEIALARVQRATTGVVFFSIHSATIATLTTSLSRRLRPRMHQGSMARSANAQVLGTLAPNQFSSDDQLRLGFEVEGFLNEVIDVDHYSFIAQAGTRVWLDLDRTSYGLDSIIEVLDADGNVLARSDNSFDEVAGTPLTVLDSSLSSNGS